MAMTHRPTNANGQRVYDLDREHVFNSWAVQGAWNPIAIEGARGCELWDFDGKRYLDFSSQQVFTNVGYQHPRLIADLHTQLDQMATLGVNFANQARSEAARAVTDLFPDTHNKVFFTNGGADANENAIRMARLFTGRRKVLSFYRSYHGNTGAAIMATGDQRRWPNEYADGHVHFFGPYLYRSAFGSDSIDEELERSLAHLRSVIELEGPTTIAAILIESMVGAAGVIPMPPGYLSGVRALCDEFDIMFIADEVMVGFGRTGKLFAYQHDLTDDAAPDLVTFAKGVNSGYVPVGGVVIRDEISEYFTDRFFPGGLTYSGHPLACASITANLAIVADESLVANAEIIGREVLGPGLQQIAADSAIVGDSRGLGLFWALELVSDKQSRDPLAPYGGSSPEMAAIANSLAEAGLLTLMLGNRIHLSPPLVINADQTRQGLDMLRQVLA